MRVGDVDLHVEERGPGPALLLIAGIPAVASDWAPVAERLAAARRVIADDGVDPALIEALVAKKSGDVQDPEGYEAQRAAALAHDAYDRLGRIAAPTLILTGDQDPVIPAASSRAMHERIPGARLVEIADAGHLFFVEHPDASARVVEDFLAAEP